MAEAPERPEFRQFLGGIHLNLGIVYARTGRLREAETAYGEAIRIQQPLVTAFPELPDFRWKLARSHGSLGALLFDTGRPEEAERAHGDALVIQRQLADAFPARRSFVTTWP